MIRGILVGAVLAGLAQPVWSQVASPGQPEWIADPRSGCRIWNAVQQVGDSITWSGDCANGLAQGHGILQWLESGKPFSRYEGDFKDGKMNGRGVFVQPDGTGYDGQSAPVAHMGREHTGIRTAQRSAAIGSMVACARVNTGRQSVPPGGIAASQEPSRSFLHALTVSERGGVRRHALAIGPLRPDVPAGPSNADPALGDVDLQHVRLPEPDSLGIVRGIYTNLT